MTDDSTKNSSPTDRTLAADTHESGDWHFAADENFGGVLFDSLAQLAHADEADQTLRERLLSAARRRNPIEQFVSRIALILDISKKSAEHAIERLSDDEAWHATSLPGVELMNVEAGSELEDCMTAFVKIEPGSGFPEHEHLGDELLLLLQGSCVDSERNERLEAGSLHISHQGTSHGSMVRDDEQEPLIYLAVVRGGLRIGDRVIDF